MASGTRTIPYRQGKRGPHGCSLTVCSSNDSFAVWLIPHTHTPAQAPVGSLVNLEYDLLAKYAERLTAGNGETEMTSLGQGVRAVTQELLA